MRPGNRELRQHGALDFAIDAVAAWRYVGVRTVPVRGGCGATGFALDCLLPSPAPGRRRVLRTSTPRSPMRQATFRRALAAAAIAAGVALAPFAPAQELKIAVAADVTSIDPHFFNLFPNNNIAEHVFDKLVQIDADSRMIPGLADVVEGDRSDDVGVQAAPRRQVPRRQRSSPPRTCAFSIDRVAQIPNSPGPFVAYTKAIVGKEIVDPYTIRFKTARAVPADAERPVDDLHRQQEGRDRRVDRGLQQRQGDGRQRAASGSSVTRTATASSWPRNDAYWGEKPALARRVTFRIVQERSVARRRAAAGDVDAIEQPPIADLPRIKSRSQLHASPRRSRIAIIYFNFDQLSE